MTDESRELTDELLGAITRELERIFAGKPGKPAPSFDFLLPITSPRDVVNFLRSIPAGIDWEELPGLAESYARRCGSGTDSTSFGTDPDPAA